MRSNSCLLVALLLAVAVHAGCDMGAPMAEEATRLPDRVTLETGDSPAALLSAWEAQGAIPRADVNGDGVVNIVDLTIVARNFGLTVEVPEPPISVVSLLMKEMFPELPGWGLYTYQLTLRNEASVPMRAVYNFRFYDSEGFYLGESIVIALLDAGETQTLRELLSVPRGDLYDRNGVPVFVEGSDYYGLEFEYAREVPADELE